MQDAFNLNGKLLEINGRIDFTSDSVCDMIGQTRCHSVSQDCIFNLMKCIINGFINGGCSIDDAVEMLHDFEKVVFPYTINIDEYYCVGLIRKGRQQRSAFHETVEKLKEMCALWRMSLMGESPKSTLVVGRIQPRPRVSCS